jgi:uncharacterized protein (DUF2384 family)
LSGPQYSFADMGLPGAKKLKAEAAKGMFSGRVKKPASVEDMDRGIEEAVRNENSAPGAQKPAAEKRSVPSVSKISKSNTRDDDMVIARKVMRENRDALRELASTAKASTDHPRAKHLPTAQAPESRSDRARPKDVPAKIWKAALAVFGTASGAKRWLYYQHGFIVYIKPIDAIQTAKGRKYILDWLETQYNVDNGVFS